MMLSKSSVFRNTGGAATSRSGNGGDNNSNKNNQNAAVLVTGPQCTAASSADEGVVNVESERYETVDVSEEQQQQQHQHHQQQQHHEQKNPLMKLLASVGGIVNVNNNNNNNNTKTANIREMDELGGREVKIVSPMNKRETCGDFDICREYSYSADDDDDEKGGGRGRNNSKAPPPLMPLGASDNTTTTGEETEHQQQQQEEEEEVVQYTYILGKTYHPMHHYTNRREDESNLFWFTYRCDFPEISPYGITSDAGWGCMLRSAQMLLAQALRMHFRGRDWRPPYLLPRRRQDPFMLSIMTWFADYPSSEQGGSIYSLHNMVAAGLKYDKLPGEWYGPGTAAYVLRDLVELHHQQQQKSAALLHTVAHNNNNSNISNSSISGSSLLDRRMFRVHVAPQGAVYRDAIQELMTMETRARLEAEKKKKHQENPQAHPLDLDWEDDLIEEVGQVEWDTALLLLIPLRLGLKTFNEDYVPAVANLFSLPQSVGILGGRPRGARWFYGAMADGKVLALDPHTVQSAPRRRTGRVNGQTKSIVELSDDYLRSCHTTYPEVCDLLKMDPSLALGFYCRHEASLQDLIYNLKKFIQENPNAPELFSIEDMSPDYAANVSSTVNEMMMDSSHSLGCDSDNFDGHHHHNDNGSDEDDYVML